MRSWSSRATACLMALGAVAIFRAAQADDAKPAAPATDNAKPAAAPAQDSGWQFMAGPYAWALGITGNLGNGKQQSSVDLSFIDIVQKSDSLIGAEGHAEALHQRFGLFFDGIYAKIGASASQSASNGAATAKLGADADLQLAFVEAGAFYRVVDRYQLWHPAPEVGGGTFSFDVLAGARYTVVDVDVKANLDINQVAAFKRDIDGMHDWVDPFIGGRVRFGLADNVDFQLRGDVGGFGVGSAFTWNTQALLGYRFTMFGAQAEAWGGYRALGQDYSEGSGRRDLNWDVVLHGPVLGMSITW